jgi:type II secretory pathway component GspD/PulD (secretin)
MDLLAHASSPPGRRARLVKRAALFVFVITGVAAGVALRFGPDLATRVAAPSLTAPEKTALAVKEAPPAITSPKLGNRSLAQWLGEIAEESRLGLVAGPELKKDVTAVFPPGTAWEDRLDALAEVGAFSYRIRGGVIEIGPAETVTPAVVSAASNQERPAEALAEPKEPDEPASTIASFRPTNARAADLAKVLGRVLDARGVTAAADAASNSLIVSGPPDAVARATEIAAEMDVPYRRFLVEAEIVEMLSASRNDLGVQWRIDAGDVTAAANFPIDAADKREGEVTVATGGTFSLKARISALEAEGRVRVVARPRVLVVEGRPASIESVRILRVRLPDTTSVVAGGDETTSATSSRAVEEFPVGITLNVEPSMLGGGRVALRVTAKSSTLGEPLPPDDIPEEFSRLVEADFFVAHGETAVLGGLARVASGRNRSGLPVLRDIPVFGLLFGRRARERDSEELVVLVTPYLLQ